MNFKLGLCLKSNTSQLFEFLFVWMFQLQFFCFLFILNHKSIQQCSQSKWSNMWYRNLKGNWLSIVQRTFEKDKEFICKSARKKEKKEKNKVKNKNKTRSTQRVQTSLAEADHYSHIAHCKNVEPWWWKTTHPPTHPPKKSFGSLPAPRSGYATTVMVFFLSYTHLRIPRSPPKFNYFFIVLPRTPR